jgi:hypothetical protein
VPRGFGFVHHSIAILYHQVPNPNITIRNFCIAVSRRLCTSRVPHCGWHLEAWSGYRCAGSGRLVSFHARFGFHLSLARALTAVAGGGLPAGRRSHEGAATGTSATPTNRPWWAHANSGPPARAARIAGVTRHHPPRWFHRYPRVHALSLWPLSVLLAPCGSGWHGRAVPRHTQHGVVAQRGRSREVYYSKPHVPPVQPVASLSEVSTAHEPPPLPRGPF